MKTLSIENKTIGTFQFSEKQMKALHSAVFKSLEAAHTEGWELVLTPKECAILGIIMFDIEEAGILD